MQPTINSPAYYLDKDDEEHCDIVYYSKEKYYNTNDIIIINNQVTNYVSNSDTKYLLKRVIAYAGQTIKFDITGSDSVVENGYSRYYYYYEISVYDQNNNNINIDQSYLDPSQVMTFDSWQLYQYKESYPFFYELFSNLVKDNTYSYTVPADNYFVMGDNRNYSADSIYFGVVHYNDIEGSVKILVAYNKTFLEAIIIKIKSYF